MSNVDNALGFFALVAYGATLLPSNLAVIIPGLKFSELVRTLLRYRREIGISTFVLSAAHAGIVIAHQQMDYFSKDFYYQSASGLLILLIFALLAFTSNRWSMKKLKKNWKRLHLLTYVAACMMPWHIAAKMTGQWTVLTHVAMPIATVSIGLLCLRHALSVSKAISKSMAKSMAKSSLSSQTSSAPMPSAPMSLAPMPTEPMRAQSEKIALSETITKQLLDSGELPCHSIWVGYRQPRFSVCVLSRQSPDVQADTDEITNNKA